MVSVVGFLKVLWEAEAEIVEGAFIVVVLFSGGASMILLYDLFMLDFAVDGLRFLDDEVTLL